MARYFKKRRYAGGKYGKKRRYGKMGYRKMKRSKAKLYRQGGNFAAPMSGKPSVELKSLDLLCGNVIPTAANQATGNTVWSGAMAQLAAYSDSITALNNSTSPAGSYGAGVVLEANNSQTGVCLNAISVGAALNQRIGRKVTMRSIKLDMVFHCSGTYTSSSTLGATLAPATNQQLTPVRILLVYDRQTNGAAAYAADVLAPIGASGLGGSSAVGTCSSNNLNNRSRFLTIYDKTHNINAYDNVCKTVRVYKKLNLPVIYNSGALSSLWDTSCIQTGALLLFCIADSEGGLTGASAMPYNSLSPIAIHPSSRLRFTDM